MSAERLQGPLILAGIALAVLAKVKEIPWMWIPAIGLMVGGVAIRNMRMTAR